MQGLGGPRAQGLGLRPPASRCYWMGWVGEEGGSRRLAGEMCGPASVSTELFIVKKGGAANRHTKANMRLCCCCRHVLLGCQPGAVHHGRQLFITTCVQLFGGGCIAGILALRVWQKHGVHASMRSTVLSTKRDVVGCLLCTRGRNCRHGGSTSAMKQWTAVCYSSRLSGQLRQFESHAVSGLVVRSQSRLNPYTTRTAPVMDVVKHVRCTLCKDYVCSSAAVVPTISSTLRSARPFCVLFSPATYDPLCCPLHVCSVLVLAVDWAPGPEASAVAAVTALHPNFTDSCSLHQTTLLNSSP